MIPLPKGFRFAAIHSGLRSEPNRLDLALIVSDRPAQAVGVFTQNRFRAAPVLLCQERLPSTQMRGIVICSGNANACTGEQGKQDAERMAELLAQSLKCSPEQVLVASTGVIGRPLPMEVMEKGIPNAFPLLSDNADSVHQAARAILTTDTRTKITYSTFTVPNSSHRETKSPGSLNDHSPEKGEKSTTTYTILGIAKGAAMIGPNMATMLGFILTDAPIAAQRLQPILQRAADRTFNCISVEGHTSTNDTVLLLANGLSTFSENSGTLIDSVVPGRGEISAAEEERFAREIEAVCQRLAHEIVADAEGGKHIIRLQVQGCRSFEEARTIAKTVANSALVKTAVYGADPNWGRFVSAAGYSSIPFDIHQLSLWLGVMKLFEKGMPLPFDAALASAYLKNHVEVTLRFQFGEGDADCTFYTSDLTPEYVHLNADYTT